MEEKKIDRRIKYTKMVIKSSFIKLLRQKPIAKITIKEICEDADVNRATFYKYYTDQYDLLNQIQNEVICNINNYLSGYDFTDKIEVAPVEMTEKILDYIGQNAELFDLLLNFNGDAIFLQEIIKILGWQRFVSQAEGGAMSKEDKEYGFYFFASGAIGVIQMWLKSGRKKTPKELADLLLKFAMEGRSSLS